MGCPRRAWMRPKMPPLDPRALLSEGLCWVQLLPRAGETGQGPGLWSVRAITEFYRWVVETVDI